MPREYKILTINAGSSSLKAAIYRIGTAETRLRVASVESVADYSIALTTVLRTIQKDDSATELDAVGHRVVIGDSRCIKPQRIDEELLRTFRELSDFAPDHMPQVLEGIASVDRFYPNLPQVACFDSAFHRVMPVVARMLALPRRFFEKGIMRYGFHGLSCEYIMGELATLDADAAKGRVLIAHLGSGSSITAVYQGASVDTSMGFTPLSGLVMGTRCGDLDPGVLLYLARQNMTPQGLNQLLNKESGLFGISGYSSDMRHLLERESTDPRSAEAIAMFCYQIRKYIGAYAAILGGLDTLVFTGGIGENAAIIRERTCAGLDFLGIALEPQENALSAGVISKKRGAVTVRVIKTNEDLMIARHTYRIVDAFHSPNSA
jgi:acetate kinase